MKQAHCECVVLNEGAEELFPKLTVETDGLSDVQIAFGGKVMAQETALQRPHRCTWNSSLVLGFS